jgi:hypothetical protein
VVFMAGFLSRSRELGTSAPGEANGRSEDGAWLPKAPGSRIRGFPHDRKLGANVMIRDHHTW